MARTVGIGYQDFAQLITNEIFYVDKTAFIKEWWENKDMVTLITRPRRFGKTHGKRKLFPSQVALIRHYDSIPVFSPLRIFPKYSIS